MNGNNGIINSGMEQVNMADRNAILTSPNQKCDKCGNYFFIEAFALKEVSSLVSPTGRNELAPIPIWLCSKCGEPAPAMKNNKNFNTIVLKDNE